MLNRDLDAEREVALQWDDLTPGARRSQVKATDTIEQPACGSRHRLRPIAGEPGCHFDSRRVPTPSPQARPRAVASRRQSPSKQSSCTGIADAVIKAGAARVATTLPAGTARRCEVVAAKQIQVASTMHTMPSAVDCSRGTSQCTKHVERESARQDGGGLSPRAGGAVKAPWSRECVNPRTFQTMSSSNPIKVRTG